MNTEDPERQLGFLIHDVARLMRRRFDRRARPLQLTRAQWQALAYLSLQDGIQQSLLAEKLDVEPITLVRLIDRMAEAGMVERRRHPQDRRAWRIFLTDKARPLLSQLREIGAATREEAMEGLSPEDRRTLIDMLQRMRANLCSRATAAGTDAEEAPHG